ncbi:hypothetical protein BDR06DRAFT_955395 [Suillus hirtellus]|nr:hypothetical protein BDR06DRAFT_955395 [Suillus hirtellus]
MHFSFLVAIVALATSVICTKFPLNDSPFGPRDISQMVLGSVVGYVSALPLMLLLMG